MFIFKRHNSYFKTHTGKIYPANKYTLEFLDAATEDQYVGYLAQKSFPLFRLVTHITPFWSTFIVAYRFLTHAWLIEWCYFLPITTILYAPCSLWIGSQIMKHRSSRKYLEWFYSFSNIIYVDYTITFLAASLYPQTKPNLLYLDWLVILSAGFAIAFRRRLKFCLFSVTLTILLDFLSALVVARMTVPEYISNRLLSLSTTFVTVLVYVFITEMSTRSSFLDEREYESWRLTSEDIHLQKLIGKGSYGEVYMGTFNNFTVAAKTIKFSNSGVKLKQEQSVSSKVINSRNPMANSNFSLQAVKSVLEKFTKFIEYYREKKGNQFQERVQVERQAQMMDRFEREIRLMCSLRHPNIVTFMGACLAKPNMILVTEYCSNGSLFDLLVNPSMKHILTPARKVAFMIGCADGLHYLHSQHPPVLHRDFKGPNILIDSKFTVKICDFGLSDVAAEYSNALQSETDTKSLKRQANKNSPLDEKLKSFREREEGKSFKASQHRIVGTIPWVAPEIFMQQPHSVKSDIYSLSMVWWEILTEKHPYSEELVGQQKGALNPRFTVPGLVHAITFESYRPALPPSSGFPFDELDLVRNCWMHDPALRFDWNSIFRKLDPVRTFMDDPSPISSPSLPPNRNFGQNPEPFNCETEKTIFDTSNTRKGMQTEPEPATSAYATLVGGSKGANCDAQKRFNETSAHCSLRMSEDEVPTSQMIHCMSKNDDLSSNVEKSSTLHGRKIQFLTRSKGIASVLIRSGSVEGVHHTSESPSTNQTPHSPENKNEATENQGNNGANIHQFFRSQNLQGFYPLHKNFTHGQCVKPSAPYREQDFEPS